jgi:serine/threonine protein kinase
VTGKVTCGPDEDFHTHESQGALPAMIRLQRQVSYFGDLESLRGLTKHVGDEDVNQEVLSMLWEDRNEDYIPYRPFSTWPEAEDYAFRDVINGTMNLDPSKRLTAAQILRLPWFSTLGDESQ